MDKAIIAIVSLVAIAGHVWLYRWVRFKMDEGALLNALENGQPHSSGELASGTSLKVDRVQQVCTRSPLIEPDKTSPELWSRSG